MEFCVKLLSLPLWERGLKWISSIPANSSSSVAPLVGAWIEICKPPPHSHTLCVAPLVGAWIEILLLPRPRYVIHVAPLVGAWIEIKINS